MFQPQAPGDGGQVHDAVGAAADGQQHAQRVLEGGRRQDAVDA
jgi:hypothetical protein